MLLTFKVIKWENYGATFAAEQVNLIKQSNAKENLSEQGKLRKPKKKAKENDGKY